MLDHVVAAIFLLVCVIGPTFAEMRIADPMGNEISDEWIKNWVREELAARDGNIEALQAQVAVRDVYRDYRCIYIPICIDIETIDALLRRLETEHGEQRDAPHLRLAHRQMQDDLAWIAATDAYGGEGSGPEAEEKVGTLMMTAAPWRRRRVRVGRRAHL